jgi:biotin carboxyl carrier protein
MADVMRPRPPRMTPTTRDAADGHDATRVPAASPRHAPDPREVRVRLAPEDPGDPPAIRVAPPPRGAGADEDPVLAQRHPLVDGEPVEAVLRRAGHGRVVLAAAGTSTRAVVAPLGAAGRGATRLEVLVDGFRFEVDVEPERLAALRERATRGRAAGGHRGPLDVRAIIPGKVVTVSVVPGDPVTVGQQLLVIEAMKMQNELRAPRDGTIARIAAAVGATVEIGDLLVVIE